MQLAVAVLFLVAVVSAVDNAGFKATVSQAGLNYAAQVGLGILQQRLKTIQIANFQGSDSVPVIGSITYTVTGIVIQTATVGSLSIRPQGGLAVAAGGVNLHLTGNWGFRRNHWPHISGHGTVDVDVTGSTASLVLTLGCSATGEPTCSTPSVAVNLAGFSVKDHGGASWLYNLLLKVFNNDIKKDLTNGIEKEMTTMIDVDLNNLLLGIPLKQKILTYGLVDYSLVSAPAIGANFVCVPGKGIFESATNPTPPPFGPSVPLPDVTNAGYMAQFFLSDLVGNSLFYALYKEGLLQYKIDAHNEPAGFPKFNTNSFEFIIPGLYFKYPGLDMSATFAATQSPRLIMDGNAQAGAFNVTASLDGAFYVVAANSSLLPVFTIDIALNGFAQVSVLSNILHVKVTAIDVELSLVSSEIGTFSTGALQVLASAAINSVVVPEINNMTAAGFAIPVIDHVELVNPVITSNPGYITISSNFQYVPSPRLYVEEDEN